MTHQDIDLVEFQSILQSCNCDLEATEVHGILCGILCTTGNPEVLRWLEWIQSHSESDQEQLSETCLHELQRVLNDTQIKLEDDQFAFYPLLPGDDTSCQHRVIALSQWCQGFLLGFSIAHPDQEEIQSDQIKEILSDFVAISNVDSEFEQDSEENEAAFSELVEYIRIVVANIREELAATMRKKTLH